MKRTRDYTVIQKPQGPVFKKYRYQKTMKNRFPGELKGMDTDIDLAAGSVLATVNTAGSSSILNLVNAGTGSYERVGRKIMLKSVRLKGKINYDFDGGTSIQSGLLRMVVVWDKSPNGSQPAFDDIFGRTSQAGTESTEFLDALKYDNTDRFQVLSDHYYSMVPDFASSNSGTMSTHYDVFVPLKDRVTVFSGQTGTVGISDISTGGLYVYFRADVNGASAPLSRFAIQSSTARLRYVDN